MLMILGIIFDYFLFKQELTTYFYWRQLLNDTKITVKNFNVSRTALQGSQHTPDTCIAVTTPELTVGILNLVS